MESLCIQHTDLPGATRLFCDLLYEFPRVAKFYPHDPWQAGSYPEAARQIVYPPERRAAMTRALAAQNPPGELLARFAQPGAVAVLTGQQVGLFGGPAYTVYKALTAAKVAANLTARGIPAVPIFWMATEDHDVAEVDHAWVFNAEGQPARVTVELAVDGPRPAGSYRIAEPPLDALRAAMGGFENSAAVLEAVEAAYPAGVTMGEGFRGVLRTLLGSIEVLTLDPLAPEIRAIGAPLLAEAARAAPELKAALFQRTAELEAAGYHAQVLVEEKTSLFFLLENGQRTPVRVKDSEWGALAGRAEALSPNALLRPVWQDYLLPTVAYVGGPGELAYFAQSAVLYKRLLGRMPVVLPRAFFTLRDHRVAKLMQRFAVSLQDILVHRADLEQRLARQLTPPELRAEFEKTAARFAAELDQLERKLAGYDATLAAAMAKSRAKVLYQLEKLRRKTERETLRRNARAAADAAYLRNQLYPEGQLQERLHSILPFLARHGMDLAERLYAEVKPDCPDHRVVTL